MGITDEVVKEINVIGGGFFKASQPIPSENIIKLLLS
jgi:hypothetical protein